MECKRALAIALLGAFSFLGQYTIPAHTGATAHSAGTWAIVQFKYWSSSGAGTGGGTCLVAGTTCAVTVSAVGAGHALICFSNMGHTLSATLSSCSGETTTSAPNFFSWNSSDGGQDARYVLSAAGGETTVTCTQSSISGLNSCGIFEASYSGPSVSYDNSNHSTPTACTSCAGQTLTLTGTNDFIMAAMNPGLNVTAVSSPYSLNAGFSDDYGVAAAVNLSSGTGPTWTQSGSAAIQVAALALKGN